jgi:hypothetical protein
MAAPVKPSSEIWGVADPSRAELGEQAGGDLVGALEDPDLLADEEHGLIPSHLRTEGVLERLTVADHGHGLISRLVRS